MNSLKDLTKKNKLKKQFYLNPVAQLHLIAVQLIKVLIAGRGFGKSFINGISILIKVATLPRSTGIFLGATYTQILTNTLKPMKSAWTWFGYVEGIDYVVGKRPPSHFTSPYEKTDRYENVITWWNGTTVIMGSMDRPQLLRGGNNDWVICDEALLVNKSQYDQIIVPSIRGSHPILKGKEGHLSEEFTSSAPYGSLGSWLWDYEAMAKNPDYETSFIIGTSWHNRIVLGDEVLKRFKRSMSPIKYLIEVMSKRLNQYGALFYPSLKDRHWYTDSFDYDYIDSLGFDISPQSQDARWDKDYKTNLPINISHDWGAFNSITIDQEIKHPFEVRFINEMFVEHPLIIDDLALQFCAYYKHHKHRVVYQWGDKSGNKREGNAKLNNFEQFADILRRDKWTVIRKKIGDIGHLERHRFMNMLHRETDTRLPKVRHNLNRCNNLRIALESAPMKDFKKDKASESNPNIKPQHATHLTDAYDYRLYHAYAKLVSKQRYVTEVSFGK